MSSSYLIAILFLTLLANVTLLVLLMKLLRSEFSSNREEYSKNARSLREELINHFEKLSHTQNGQFKEGLKSQETFKGAVEERLEKMRETVEEKLQGTLERRLSQSFKQVESNLHRVQLGLGEMKHLAQGVGDLKKVLANVKSRGMWGEFQLGNILEEILSPQQYEKNVAINKNSVEYAVKLPGQGLDKGPCIYLE